MQRLRTQPALRTGMWILVGALYLLPLVGVKGAFDAFMKIEGVDGESTDAKHKDWIEIESFNFGVSKPVQGAGSSRTNGPAQFKEVVVSKWIDKASPVLMLGACQGKVFPKVELDLVARKVGAPTETYMRYSLQNVLVTSVQPGGPPSGVDALPTESLSLNFLKIEMDYSQVDPATGDVIYRTNAACVVEDQRP